MTGRGAGFCAGFGIPGSMRGAFFGGRGRGWGGGFYDSRLAGWKSLAAAIAAVALAHLMSRRKAPEELESQALRAARLDSIVRGVDQR